MSDRFYLTGLLVLVIGAAALSGCVGDGKGPKGPSEGRSTDVAPPAGEAQVSETTGAIDGRVADTAFNPLPGARVTVLEPPGGNSTTTDAEGRFVLNDLEPGQYKLVAERLGYDSKGVVVTVKAGEVSRVTFTLPPLAVEGLQRIEPYEFGGFIDCGFGIGPGILAGANFCNDPNARSLHKINMTAGVRSVVLALKWNPTGGVMGTELFMEGLSDIEGCNDNFGTGCPEYNSTEGRGPLVMRIDHDQLKATTGSPEKDNGTAPLMIRVFPAWSDMEMSLYFQQSYRLYVHVFYNQSAPAEFTGLPDE